MYTSEYMYPRLGTSGLTSRSHVLTKSSWQLKYGCSLHKITGKMILNLRLALASNSIRYVQEKEEIALCIWKKGSDGIYATVSDCDYLLTIK